MHYQSSLTIRWIDHVDIYGRISSMYIKMKLNILVIVFFPSSRNIACIIGRVFDFKIRWMNHVDIFSDLGYLSESEIELPWQFFSPSLTNF